MSMIVLGGLQIARAQTEPPGPQMPPLPQGLDPPPTIFPPTQVGEGSQVYYQVCMACHGDRGQGLTDAWRGQLDPPDRNCWQSGCHAPRHPPGGFVFPKAVPPVANPEMLVSFPTALDLYQFIHTSMPFQAPGSLSDEQYWQLTAFLMDLNSVDPGDAPLTPANAAGIAFGARSSDPLASPVKKTPDTPEEAYVGGLVALVVVLFASVGWLLHKRH